MMTGLFTVMCFISSGHAPEWGAAAAEMPDDVPLEGPALAPYGQASDEGD